MDKILGGYYLKARCIQNSEIANCPPHFREIWDWLIKEVNYKDQKTSGKIIKKGQCLTSYKEIREGLHWMVGWRKQTYSKNDCETAMKWLKKHTMVHTTKTTRGMIVTILNYNRYQEPRNYEAYNETRRAHTVSIQPTDTIRKERNKEKKKRIKKDITPPISPPTTEDLKKYLIEKISGNGLEQYSENLLEFVDYRMSMKKERRYQTTRGIDVLLSDLKGLVSANLNIVECLDETMGRNWLSPRLKYFTNGRTLKNKPRILSEAAMRTVENLSQVELD